MGLEPRTVRCSVRCLESDQKTTHGGPLCYSRVLAASGQREVHEAFMHLYMQSDSEGIALALTTLGIPAVDPSLHGFVELQVQRVAALLQQPRATRIAAVARTEVRAQMQHEDAARRQVDNERKAAELPYQMMHGGEFKRLEKFLLDIPRFLALDKARHHDLHFFWRAVGTQRGAPLSDLGERYGASIERYKEVLLVEIRRKYHEYDSRREDECLDFTARIYARVGLFLSELELYSPAVELQARALEIDHTLFNNMSRRVAESTNRLATTQYAMGDSQEAVQNLYLAFGIY